MKTKKGRRRELLDNSNCRRRQCLFLFQLLFQLRLAPRTTSRRRRRRDVVRIGSRRLDDGNAENKRQRLRTTASASTNAGGGVNGYRYLKNMKGLKQTKNI
jgi:hypothetical protein